MGAPVRLPCPSSPPSSPPPDSRVGQSPFDCVVLPVYAVTGPSADAVAPPLGGPPKRIPSASLFPSLDNPWMPSSRGLHIRPLPLPPRADKEFVAKALRVRVRSGWLLLLLLLALPLLLLPLMPLSRLLLTLFLLLLFLRAPVSPVAAAASAADAPPIARTASSVYADAGAAAVHAPAAGAVFSAALAVPVGADAVAPSVCAPAAPTAGVACTLLSSPGGGRGIPSLIVPSRIITRWGQPCMQPVVARVAPHPSLLRPTSPSGHGCLGRPRTRLAPLICVHASVVASDAPSGEGAVPRGVWRGILCIGSLLLSPASSVLVPPFH